MKTAKYGLKFNHQISQRLLIIKCEWGTEGKRPSLFKSQGKGTRLDLELRTLSEIHENFLLGVNA